MRRNQIQVQEVENFPPIEKSKTRDAVAVVGSRACEREGIGVLHVCACSSHESYGSQSFLMILKIRWLPIYVWLRLLIGVLKVLCLLMNLKAY